MGTDNQRHSSQDLQNRVFNYGKQEQLEKKHKKHKSLIIVFLVCYMSLYASLID